MPRIWVLAADAARARLFEFSVADHGLREIEDFLNPSGRSHDRDLRSDAEGRYGGGGLGRQAHTAPRHANSTEHETERFTKRLGDYLDRMRTQNRFDRLYLIGAPRFLGFMRRKLSKQAQHLVADEIPKDVSRCSAREIEHMLREQTQRQVL